MHAYVRGVVRCMRTTYLLTKTTSSIHLNSRHLPSHDPLIIAERLFHRTHSTHTVPHPANLPTSLATKTTSGKRLKRAEISRPRFDDCGVNRMTALAQLFHTPELDLGFANASQRFATLDITGEVIGQGGTGRFSGVEWKGIWGWGCGIRIRMTVVCGIRKGGLVRGKMQFQGH